MLTFSGEFVVPRAPSEVYRFLMDPHRLVKCVPDLKRHEIQDEDHFSVTVLVGLGRIRGPMNMRLEITDKQEDSCARIVAKGSMLASQVSGDGSFTLSRSSDSATLVSWIGQARVGGYLMHLIGGALDSLVQEHLERFVRALEAELIGEGVAAIAVPNGTIRVGRE